MDADEEKLILYEKAEVFVVSMLYVHVSASQGFVVLIFSVI